MSTQNYEERLQKAIEEEYARKFPTCSCQFCEGTEGKEELVWTGDEESFGGWEIWFCCKSCQEKGQPSETFMWLDIPEEFKHDHWRYHG